MKGKTGHEQRDPFVHLGFLGPASDGLPTLLEFIFWERPSHDFLASKLLALPIAKEQKSKEHAPDVRKVGNIAARIGESGK